MSFDESFKHWNREYAFRSVKWHADAQAAPCCLLDPFKHTIIIQTYKVNVFKCRSFENIESHTHYACSDDTQKIIKNIMHRVERTRSGRLRDTI